MRMVDLDQRSDAWFIWRRQGITATEAVAICGYSAFSTPWRVWAEKTGRVAPPDLSNNPYVQYGVDHEDEVRNIFALKHVEPILVTCGEYDEYPVFRASFDGLTTAQEPVEIKCPGESTLEDVLTRREKSDAYQMYQWQVQWQMLVSGAQNGWLVFYLGDGKIEEFQIARNEGMIQEMKTKCQIFWEQNILRDKAPDKLPERDIFVPKGRELIEWGKAARDFRKIKAEIDRLTDLLEEPKKRLVELMGNYKNADFYGVSVCQYTQKGSVDFKKALTNRGITLTEQELETCRRKPHEIQKVTVSSSEFPKDFIPERNQEISQAIQTIQADLNNLVW